MPIQSPPLDGYDKVVPHDHPDIADDHGIIRRVSERQVVTDKSGIRRISTIAFRPSTGEGAGMSVDLEALMLDDGIEPQKYVTSPKWTGSVRFTAGTLRGEGFSVGYDPLPDNPYHGEVWGKFSKGNQKRLQEIAAWFVQLDGVELQST